MSTSILSRLAALAAAAVLAVPAAAAAAPPQASGAAVSGDGQSFIVTLRPGTDPSAVAAVRTEASRRLSGWGLEELAFTTELILSELVTNSIRYAAGPIEVRLLRDRGLICEVADASGTSPHLRYAETTDEGGRGLFLVAQLGERWGVRYTTQGKIIWVEQRLPRNAVVPPH